jgi:hypothetical protein
MCQGNCCPARNPEDGPCPQGYIDHHECLGGDHGCECLAEKDWRQALLQSIKSRRQQKIMTDKEEAEFQAAAKTAGLPCGDD